MGRSIETEPSRCILKFGGIYGKINAIVVTTKRLSYCLIMDIITLVVTASFIKGPFGQMFVHSPLLYSNDITSNLGSGLLDITSLFTHDDGLYYRHCPHHSCSALVIRAMSVIQPSSFVNRDVISNTPSPNLL